MKVEYITFDARAERTAYVARRFQQYLRGRILDVGCDQAVLRDLLPDAEYTGVDVSGRPDIELDLEKAEKLPFENGAFDCVICIDVLEHLDNLHRVFGELVRVTREYLVISLPNCWCGARKPIARGRGELGHYGLPVERPPDRHKWFFSLTQARDFLEGQASTSNITVVDVYATEKPRPLLVRVLRRLRYPKRERYLNRYSHTLWAVLQKK